MQRVCSGVRRLSQGALSEIRRLQESNIYEVRFYRLGLTSLLEPNASMGVRLIMVDGFVADRLENSEAFVRTDLIILQDVQKEQEIDSTNETRE